MASLTAPDRRVEGAPTWRSRGHCGRTYDGPRRSASVVRPSALRVGVRRALICQSAAGRDDGLANPPPPREPLLDVSPHP